MENLRKTVLAVLAALLMWSCNTIHNFPEGEGVDPYLTEVNLDIGIDMNFEGEISPQTYAAYSSMLEGDYDIRYIVEIYKDSRDNTSNLTERVARIVQTSDAVVTEGKVRIVEKIRIPAAEYVAMAWVDFVSKGGRDDCYYDTEKLTAVSILEPDGENHGYDTTKDAFCGSVAMDLSCFRGQRFADYTAVCPVRRPLAVYRIITTDIERYLTYNKTLAPYSSIRPSTTDLFYQLYFPTGYNVQFEEPGQYKTGEGYCFDIVETASGQEAVVASDFVLVSPDAFFYVDFTIRDAGARHINTIKNLRIDLKRNMVTIIRGEFLTKEHNSGGIGIDDGFEGEEIIVRID